MPIVGPKHLILGEFTAKLQLLASIIFFVRNVQLTVGILSEIWSVCPKNYNLLFRVNFYPTMLLKLTYAMDATQ